ncbi:MAG: tyrosine-type recombinase/integrase [Acidimicrobiales bacterium]
MTGRTNGDLLAMSLDDQRRRALRPHSIVNRQGALRALARWLEPKPLAEATREDIDSFLDTRRLAPRSRYTYLSHLHSFYAMLVAEGVVEHDPTARIVRPRLRRALPRPMSTEELREVLATADPRFRCWLLLGAYQGLRCQEIALLDREDVREAESLLRVVHGKGGHERMLPLHPEVMEALRALPMPRSGWVFVRGTGKPFTPGDLSAEFNRRLREAGASATAHQLRHWFGTELYRRTRDLRLTQELLGHASPTTTAVYTAFDRGAAGAAVAGLRAAG